MERRQALTSSTGATGITEAPGQDFYLAIHKKELGSRWFMAAYLTQAAPQGEASGAARSLGTRVVSFKVQNGKLFVFDAGDHNASSDPFRPELLLEAYPIVQGYGPFERQKGSSDYVLFDPAAGLNRFRLLHGCGGPARRWTCRSRSGSARSATAPPSSRCSAAPRARQPQPGSVPGRVTGTLSLALRRYAEGEGYSRAGDAGARALLPQPQPDHRPTRATPGSWPRAGTSSRDAPPVLWKIAPLAEKLRQHPAFPEVRPRRGREARHRGLERGVRVHRPRGDPLGNPDDSWADDDVNMLHLGQRSSAWALRSPAAQEPKHGRDPRPSVYFPAAGSSRPTTSRDDNPGQQPVPAGGGETTAGRACAGTA